MIQRRELNADDIGLVSVHAGHDEARLFTRQEAQEPGCKAWIHLVENAGRRIRFHCAIHLRQVFHVLAGDDLHLVPARIQRLLQGLQFGRLAFEFLRPGLQVELLLLERVLLFGKEQLVLL